MKVYELKLKYDHLVDMEYDAFVMRFENIEDFRFNIGGIEKVIPNHPIYLVGNLRIMPEKTDYPIIDIGISVMSNKMISVLESQKELKINKILVKTIDDTYLDGYFDNKGDLKQDVPQNNDYSIIQILEYSELFDYENSIFKPLRSNPNMPGIIRKLVIKEPEKGFSPIFKIKEKSSKLFVSDKAKEALEANNIKGCIFEEVEVTPYNS